MAVGAEHGVVSLTFLATTSWISLVWHPQDLSCPEPWSLEFAGPGEVTASLLAASVLGSGLGPLDTAGPTATECSPGFLAGATRLLLTLLHQGSSARATWPPRPTAARDSSCPPSPSPRQPVVPQQQLPGHPSPAATEWLLAWATCCNQGFPGWGWGWDSPVTWPS